MGIISEGKVRQGSGLGSPLRYDGSPVSVNEVQTITGTATGGTATYSFGGAATAAQTNTVSAATLQTALRALSTINGANVTCTGGPLGTNPIVCTFSGTLAGTDVAMIVVGAGYTGGSATVVETTKGVAPAFQTIAAVAALLIDVTNSILYINTGTTAFPVWTKVGTQT